MCGITGFIDYHNTVVCENLLASAQSLRHRGGNGQGHLFEENPKYRIGIANERLSTIDPVTNSNQPFTSSCGNYTITFNGTIYNYEELRSAFIRQGITFKTQSDTEVLIECYKKWNEQLFKYIDGAFAFAILDRKRHQLFLARDAMGVKPLYWYKDERIFAFASETHALFHYGVRKTLNRNVIPGYLRRAYVAGEDTFFEGIKNFNKQHFMRIDINSGNYLINRYEGAPSAFHANNNDEAEVLKQVDTLITNSVLRRYTADVPAAVLLSSGYDSATVAAVLQYNTTKKIKTFTLGFEEKKYDEAKYAQEIAKYINTNHHEIYISKADAVTTLEKLPEIFDEPMGDSGAIPLAFILKEVNKHQIKVVLGAEGGDELFAGYENYQKALRLHEVLPKIPKFLQNMGLIFAGSKAGKLKEAIEAPSLLHIYEALSAYFTKQEVNTLLNFEEKDSILLDKNENSLQAILRYDQAYYLPNDLLMKSDRIAMHYGIDNRDALLSTELVNYVNSIETNLLFKNNTLKYLLKNTTHRYIPQHLLDRPKQGFSIPLVSWMSTIFKPQLMNYLSEDKLSHHNLFNLKAVTQLKNHFFRRPNAAGARKLWLLLQFQMWYEKQFR